MFCTAILTSNTHVQNYDSDDSTKHLKRKLIRERGAAGASGVIAFFPPFGSCTLSYYAYHTTGNL